MAIGILDYEVENSITGYPLQPMDSTFFGIIVDANFVQFDGFVPTLNTILVSATDITITMTFDVGQIVFSGTNTITKSQYEAGTTWLALYDNLNGYSNRYIGVLTFGEGLAQLWQTSVSQLLEINTQFVSTVVRSIPSAAAVYTVNDRFGDIILGKLGTDTSIFYNVDTALNGIVLNATQYSQLPNPPPSPALKQINLVTPVGNSVFLGSNDVIKITGNGIGSLQINLVGTNEIQPVTTPPTPF